MGTAHCSEMLANFYRTTRRYTSKKALFILTYFPKICRRDRKGTSKNLNGNRMLWKQNRTRGRCNTMQSVSNYTATFGATIWLKTTVAYSKVISQHSPGRTGKCHKIRTTPPEYEQLCEPSGNATAILQYLPAHRYRNVSNKHMPNNIDVFISSHTTKVIQLRRLVARVRCQVKSCGICGEQSGTGAVFLRVYQSPLLILNPPNAPYSSVIWALYHRPVSGRRTKWTVSPHITKLQKKKKIEN
jgi:hypothetical protein